MLLLDSGALPFQAFEEEKFMLAKDFFDQTGFANTPAAIENAQRTSWQSFLPFGKACPFVLSSDKLHCGLS